LKGHVATRPSDEPETTIITKFSTWASAILSLTVVVLGAVSLSEPWYNQTQTANNVTQATDFGWSGTTVTYSGVSIVSQTTITWSGATRTTDVATLFQTTLALTCLAFILSVFLFVLSCIRVAGLKVDSLGPTLGSMPFGIGSIVGASLVTVFYAVAAFNFASKLPGAVASDSTRCTVNFCNSFAGSDHALSWGPDPGWTLAVASFAISFASIPFNAAASLCTAPDVNQAGLPPAAKLRLNVK